MNPFRSALSPRGRRAAAAVMLFASAFVAPLETAVALAVPAPADGCTADHRPALELAGPAEARSGADPVVLTVMWRCTDVPAAGAHVRAVGKRGHVVVPADGRLLMQFGGAQVARLYARDGVARSNLLVVTVR